MKCHVNCPVGAALIGQTDKGTDGSTDRQTDKGTDGSTDGETDKGTDGSTDGHDAFRDCVSVPESKRSETWWLWGRTQNFSVS
jgi:hypothetical protein